MRKGVTKVTNGARAMLYDPSNSGSSTSVETNSDEDEDCQRAGYSFEDDENDDNTSSINDDVEIGVVAMRSVNSRHNATVSNLPSFL